MGDLEQSQSLVGLFDPIHDRWCFNCTQAGSIVALKECSLAIKDLTFDIDGLVFSKAKTKVEDTPTRMVIMGDAYRQREKTNKPNCFVRLIGEKGKVLLTFFTEQ